MKSLTLVWKQDVNEKHPFCWAGGDHSLFAGQIQLEATVGGQNKFIVFENQGTK